MKRLFIWLTVWALLLGALPATAMEASFNWYEVFVYSYKDSDGDGLGDLKGLISKLDYISDMGFSGLWLMPVMPSPSYHKYDVKNYTDIDPEYGNLDDLKELAAACHLRNIRVILDMPLNHTSTQHPWFIEACQALQNNQSDNRYVDYYHFREGAAPHYVNVESTNWHYEEQFAGGGMPDLNLDNEEVRAEIRKIFTFWLVDCNVDGFRLDAVTSYYSGDDDRNIAFLHWLKETAELIKPGSYLVGECWKGLSVIARYYESSIDSFFLFPASQAEGYSASIRSRKPAATFTNNLVRVLEAIPDRILAPFLSNHDTGRTVGIVQGRQSLPRVKFAHALNALISGFTFTYYGEEIGMAGSGEDPNKRLGMYWRENDVTLPPPGTTRIEYPFASVGCAGSRPELASALHQKTEPPEAADAGYRPWGDGYSVCNG